VSAPPLPEVFGNYALGDFVEVVSPEAISWLPQTVGWRVLGVILLGLAIHRSWRWLLHWYRNRYRREAAVKLQQFSARAGATLRAEEVNRVLKLTALAAFPRDQVAGLYGKAWVDFLNGQCPAAPFGAELAELLAIGSYRAVSIEGTHRRELLAASLCWVRQHENPWDD